MFTGDDAASELVQDVQTLVVLLLHGAELEEGVVHEPRGQLALLGHVDHRLDGVGVAGKVRLSKSLYFFAHSVLFSLLRLKLHCQASIFLRNNSWVAPPQGI